MEHKYTIDELRAICDPPLERRGIIIGSSEGEEVKQYMNIMVQSCDQLNGLMGSVDKHGKVRAFEIQLAAIEAMAAFGRDKLAKMKEEANERD